MMKKLALLLLMLVGAPLFAHKVGLLVVATGKYTKFVPPLLESARTHFCTGHDVTFFIFTDGHIEDASPDVVVLPHKRYGWPYDTLFRYIAYWGHKQVLQEMDYLYACDVDMLFVDAVGDEILSDRVGTMHPGFVGKRGSYETCPQSKACVAPHEGEYYFAGGFYGGKTIIFFAMLHDILLMVKSDLDRNMVAVWHDESYLNRYFIDHKPTLVLPRPYCARPFDQPQKLIALDKNHSDMRA